MDTTTAGVPTTTSPHRTFDGATRDAAPEPEADPGWLVLRNCALGDDGPRVGLVLVHPSIGVALVDFAREATDAVGRLRRAFDARRFPAIFGGYPPVARAVLPAVRLPDLGRILAAQFKAQPPLALAGGDAWVRTARAAIEAERPIAAPEPLRARKRRGLPWRTAALTVLAGASVCALVAAMLVLPRRGSEEPARRAFAAVTAQGIAPGFPLGTVPESEDPTPDTPSALSSPAKNAVTALSAAPHPGPEAVPAGEEFTALEVLAALLPAEPAAGAGGEVAADPHTSESPPTPTAALGENPPEPTPVPVAPAASSDRAIWQAPPSATAVLDASDAAFKTRSPARRAAVPVDASSRSPPSQAPASGGPRAVLPATPAEAGDGRRCRDIVARATAEGVLSDEDKAYLRRGCQGRG